MKFKVIKKDRFLKMEEMSEVKGGEICVPKIGYRNCNANGYITCKVETIGLSIYQSGPCPDGQSVYVTCLGDMTYRTCMIGSGKMSCSQDYEIRM